MPAENIIQLRQGTASQWSAINPVLSNGEMGYETDTRRSKTGDGVTEWNSLTYNVLNPSGLLAGSGINILLDSNNATATISISGLNSSYITNFNAAVSELIPTISNSGDNRLLTSTGSSTSINAEPNLVFDGSRLGINVGSPSGSLHVIGSGLISSITGIAPNAMWHLYSAISGDRIFNVEGTNGSLFSIDDNLSGTLMSVNNNAGLPVFEVFSDDRVVAGRFAQNDFIINSSGNIGIGTSSPSGKMHVSGFFIANSGNFIQNLSVSGINVSLDNHKHVSNDILNFNQSVSGLVDGIYGKVNLGLGQFSSTTSSSLLSIISDEVGSGFLVFNNSPVLTGIPIAPTAPSGTNSDQIATTKFVRSEISAIANIDQNTIDSINELVNFLQNSPIEKTIIAHSSPTNLSPSFILPKEYIYIYSNGAEERSLILPTAVNNKTTYTLKNNTIGNIYLETSSNETIDGYSRIGLNKRFMSISVISDGSSWIIV